MTRVQPWPGPTTRVLFPAAWRTFLLICLAEDGDCTGSSVPAGATHFSRDREPHCVTGSLQLGQVLASHDMGAVSPFCV